MLTTKGAAILLLVVAAALLYSAAGENLTFESLKENSSRLENYVRKHYGLSVGLLAAGFVLSALIIPGTLILTLAAGYLFGVVEGALYSALFSTVGAMAAFFLSRYFMGNEIQKHYLAQLKRFNREITRRGASYLFMLRVIPIMPFFAVNYLAGLTRIPGILFLLVTFAGLAPGAFVYALAGSRLQNIQSIEDLLSGRMLAALLLLGIFSLLPFAYDALTKLRRQSRNRG